MKDMAKKLKLMSLFQELSGRAQLTNRRPAPAAAGVYLMQLRSKTGTATVVPRRRFQIAVDLSKASPAPLPVKINHVPAALESSARREKPVTVAASVRVVSVPQVHSKAG